MPAAKSSRKPRTGRRESEALSWITRRSGGMEILEVRALLKFPWLVHGFSTRRGGFSELDGAKVLNLGFTEWDQSDRVRKNRERFVAALAGNVDPKKMPLVPLKQIHSDLIHRFLAAPQESCQGDASLTDRPGLLLAVGTADCVPILLVDPEKRAVAAVHAGWRGTLARIAAKTVGQMHMHFGSRPLDLQAAIGPSIGGCCYEVGTEVATQFTSQFADAADYFDELRTGDEPNPLEWLNRMPPGHQPPPKNVLLDLRKANRAQLLAAGVNEQNIAVSDLCTSCRRDLFFSYRKEGPATGRMLSAIGIRAAEAR